jgi:hypothetical protein
VGIDGILEEMQARHEQRHAAAGDGEAGSGGGQDAPSTSGRGGEAGSGGGAAASWRQRGGGRGSLKVVANLPYNITKDFLKATLPLGGPVSELSIMIQHEVAERLVDPTPGRPDYRAMSVYTHYYSSPKYRCGRGGGWGGGAAGRRAGRLAQEPGHARLLRGGQWGGPGSSSAKRPH